MLQTPQELLQELGTSIRARRIGQRWSQEEAAVRAGMSVRTWRRLESAGQATIENLIRAAFALRCEQGVAQLFPATSATTLDELLERQAATATPELRRRAPRRSGSR